MIELTAWERRRLALLGRNAPNTAQKHRRLLAFTIFIAVVVVVLYAGLLLALKLQANELGLSLGEAFRLLGNPPRALSAAQANVAGQSALAEMLFMAVIVLLLAPTTVWFSSRDAALQNKVIARLRELNELP